MKTDLKEHISYSVLEALESAAFLFADEGAVEPDSQVEIMEWPGWKIRFGGPASGVIRMIMPDALAESITANMLGIDKEAVSREMIDDAAGELLNIACGHFLTQHFGENPVFDISIPEKQLRAGAMLRDADPDNNVWLSVEGVHLITMVDIEWSVY